MQFKAGGIASLLTMSIEGLWEARCAKLRGIARVLVERAKPTCEIALIPQNFFVGGNVLLRSTAHTPISENAVSGSLLNCQGSCINDRYHDLPSTWRYYA